MRLDAESARLSRLKLEEALLEEKTRHSDILEEEKDKYRTEVAALIEHHRNTIAERKLECY